MSDNQDALRCAKELESIVALFGTPSSRNAEREGAAHIRRLVAENEAKDALLRQAVEALNNLSWYADTCEIFLRETHPGKSASLRERVSRSIQTIAAIRQHREAR